MDYVIIGAGPSGVVAAESIRTKDADAKITIIGDEKGRPYARMAIPYLLTGMIGEDGTWLRKDDDHFSQSGITLCHDRVLLVDPKKKQLTLQSGKTQIYDKLLVATGSSAITPPIDGIDLDGVVNCWTLDDARVIAERANKGSRVVLIGAGFIGCIILEALAERGVELSVIEGADRMVPRMMDAVSGGMIANWCKHKGIDVQLSTKVESIAKTDKGDTPLVVATDKGDTIEADLVVVAAGVKANTDFLAGTGVEINHGIIVNDHMQTSEPDIYAAGDVAEGRDFSTGFRGVHAIQPTAVDHGRVAGLNMAGFDTAYHGSLNMNVLDTVGLVSASFGLWDGGENPDVVVCADEEGFLYLKLAFDGDALVGAISIGRTDFVGMLRGLIQSRRKLGVWKDILHKDPNRIAEVYVALTQPHSPLVRA